MDAAQPHNPTVLVKPALRSGQFLAGTFLVAVVTIGTAVLLLRRLNVLPLGTAGSLIAGVLLLIGSWRLALWQYERIAQVLAARDSGESTPLLSACARYIERGLVMLGLAALMFLTALVQVFAK